MCLGYFLVMFCVLFGFCELCFPVSFFCELRRTFWCFHVCSVLVKFIVFVVFWYTCVFCKVSVVVLVCFLLRFHVILYFQVRRCLLVELCMLFVYFDVFFHFWFLEGGRWGVLT